MARCVNVSFPESEKELWFWLQEKINKKEISSSLIFRDAVLQKKREDDALHSENPKILHERIASLKEVLGKLQTFIIQKGLDEEWLDFEVPQKFIEAPTETIVEDHSQELLEVSS